MTGEQPRSLVLETCVHLVFHPVLATSLFFLFAGHSSPGGGFVGGLVAGSAFVLRYLVTGNVVAMLRLHPATVLGAGLLLAAGTGTAPWLVGGQVLQSAHTDVHVPVLGAVPLTSALAFDAGVYLIVVGLTLGVLSTLGAQLQASLAGDVSSDEEQDDETEAGAEPAGRAAAAPEGRL